MKYQFIGRNWLKATDSEGRIRYINLNFVKRITWWTDELKREWVFVLLVGDEYSMEFYGEDFPTQQELDEFLANQA
jgi:hypothetical protein